MRQRVTFILAICLALVLSLQPVAMAGPPRAAGASMGGSPGTWYVGATPPNVDYSKPVLVFVHGKGGWSGDWWEPTVYHGSNDMYSYAYSNGYRTAFVDLIPEASMWTNGQLLNRQLNEITAYFGVSRVTIIAHSKGGVDANAAAVHYGASAKISQIITLGSPHGGSPLADMAFSTWTWWLAALLGQRGDATYVLQTGYMSYYRSVTDGRGNAVPYHTLSGDRCGPVFTALWMGCAFIAGEDDGMVPVWSTRIPGGTHVKEGSWDHDEIRMGSRTWSWFAPLLRAGATEAAGPPAGGQPEATAAQARPGGPPGGAGGPVTPGNAILRGGNTAEHPVTHFPVESGVRSATFTFLASGPDFRATLVGPDGSTRTVGMKGRVPADDLFAGAWLGTVTIQGPAAGQWRLQADAPARTGYLMMLSLDSDLHATLGVGQALAAPGSRQSLAVGFRGRAPAASQAEAAFALAGQQPYGRTAFQGAAGALNASLTIPAGNSIHNVTVTVTGTLPDGTAFERTLATSFAAVAPGARGAWR